MKPFTVTLLRHGDTPLSGRLIGQRSDPPPTAAAQVRVAVAQQGDGKGRHAAPEMPASAKVAISLCRRTAI